MKVTELKPAMQEFLSELQQQMDGQVAGIFEMVLAELGKPGKDDADKLKFLACLQAAGVDNWSGYDEALDLMDEDPDEEEDNGEYGDD